MNKRKSRARNQSGGAPTQTDTAKPAAKSLYMRDTQSGIIASRPATLREHRDEIRRVWMRASALAMDMLQNSGRLRGTADQILADTIGVELQLNPRPELKAFGYDAKEATDFVRLVKARFKAWAWNPQECDFRAKFTIPQNTDIGMRHWLAYGESLGIVSYVPVEQRLLPLKLDLGQKRLALLGVEVALGDFDGRLQFLNLGDGDRAGDRQFLRPGEVRLGERQPRLLSAHRLIGIGLCLGQRHIGFLHRRFQARHHVAGLDAGAATDLDGSEQPGDGRADLDALRRLCDAIEGHRLGTGEGRGEKQEGGGERGDGLHGFTLGGRRRRGCGFAFRRISAGPCACRHARARPGAGHGAAASARAIRRAGAPSSAPTS